MALLLVVLVLPSMVGAQTFDIKKGIVGNISCAADGSCGFCDWIDLFVILQKVILSLFGGLALIMMIWAGQGLITAGGNETKISESKKLIGTTILGVVIVLAGYFLVNVLIGILLTPEPEMFEALFGNIDKITNLHGLIIILGTVIIFVLTKLIGHVTPFNFKLPSILSSIIFESAQIFSLHRPIALYQ